MNGQPGVKAGEQVPYDAEIELIEPDCPYVSRGGLKLAGALDTFDIHPDGFHALDIGASTGGFTDCLLKRGVVHVTALDVGKGLIAWNLRNDPRVTVIEKINARNIDDVTAPGPFDLIVADVSFISLKLILPNLPVRMKPDGLLLTLIKPQFEAGRGKAPGGIVIDPEIWRNVLRSFTSPLIFSPSKAVSPGLAGFALSRISGREGNREFFGLWKMGHDWIGDDEISMRINLAVEHAVKETD